MTDVEECKVGERVRNGGRVRVCRGMGVQMRLRSTRTNNEGLDGECKRDEERPGWW